MSLRKLIVGTTGIYAAYLTSSILSERLYSNAYQSIKNPAETSQFHYPSLIVWFSSLLCAIFGILKGKADKEPPSPISRKEQIILAFFYAANILATNYALLYISYLDQALGRNCRYLTVVIVGAYFSRVKKGSNLKISPKKILVAAVITLGVIMFTLCGEQKNKGHNHLDPSQSWKGYLILGVSLVVDAFFSDSQAYVKATFKPTANHLLVSTSIYSFLFVFIGNVLTGEIIQQIHFCINHPSVIFDIVSMSTLQVLGQVSIYYVINNFKQHMFPLISTTRKVFTVLLSILIFGHHVNGMQWLSIALVFGGLAYELYEQLQGKKHKHQSQQVKENNETNVQVNQIKAENKQNLGQKQIKKD